MTELVSGDMDWLTEFICETRLRAIAREIKVEKWRPTAPPRPTPLYTLAIFGVRASDPAAFSTE